MRSGSTLRFCFYLTPGFPPNYQRPSSQVKAKAKSTARAHSPSSSKESKPRSMNNSNKRKVQKDRMSTKCTRWTKGATRENNRGPREQQGTTKGTPWEQRSSNKKTPNAFVFYLRKKLFHCRRKSDSSCL